jgi:hypothetical protein
MPHGWTPPCWPLGSQRGHLASPHRPIGVRSGISRQLIRGLSILVLCSFMPAAGRAHGAAGPLFARGWQHILINAPGIAQSHAQLVLGGPGLVAFAPGYPGKTGLWTSADGRRWQSARLPSFERGVVPWSFFAASRLFLITGTAGRQHRIWASQDEGATSRPSLPVATGCWASHAETSRLNPPPFGLPGTGRRGDSWLRHRRPSPLPRC